MSLGLLEIVASVQRIHPRLKQELAPLAVPNHHAAGDQTRAVLADNEIDLIWPQVRKRLDNAIRRHNRVVLDHQALESLPIQQLVLQRLVHVHDVGVLVEVPDEAALGELGQRMSHSHEFRPRLRRSLGVVVVGLDDESLVSYDCACQRLSAAVDRLDAQLEETKATHHALRHTARGSP